MRTRSASPPTGRGSRTRCTARARTCGPSRSLSAGGGEAERVTDDPGEERGAIWSPDGRSLSYFLSGTGAREGLYVISKDQTGRWGRSRQVWNHPTRGDWSPDGRTLVSAWTDGVW